MKPALLIIDVQQALCVGDDGAHDIDAVVDRINGMASRARAAGAPVMFVQHEEGEGPLQHGHAGWQLYSRLEAQAGDPRIRKTLADSFHHTGLHDALQSRGIDTLVVCGLQSECCVDSTVRGALALGYPVVLASDAHTTMHNGVLTAPQISAHHNVTLASLGGYGSHVTPIPAADVRFDG